MADESNYNNSNLLYFVLIHLDGILEDNRQRAKFYLDVMNDFKAPLPLADILMKFISKASEIYLRDIASHILVLIFDAEKYEKIGEAAIKFLKSIMF